jgi:hypothetical protein
MKYQVGDLLSSRYDLTLTDINNVNFECCEGDLLLVIEDMDKNNFYKLIHQKTLHISPWHNTNMDDQLECL